MEAFSRIKYTMLFVCALRASQIIYNKPYKMKPSNNFQTTDVMVFFKFLHFIYSLVIKKRINNNEKSMNMQ